MATLQGIGKRNLSSEMLSDVHITGTSMKQTKQSQLMENFKKSRGIQTKTTSIIPEMTDFLPTIGKDDGA